MPNAPSPLSSSDAADPRPYRRGVGAVLFNREGLVFVAERHNVPGAWQFPQGGIDRGEDARAAVMRELGEEIGTQAADILAETDDWLRYDLPSDLRNRAWRGRFRGQEQKWFALRFTGTDAAIRLDAHTPAEFVRWRWQPFEAAVETVIGFKQPLYRILYERFARFAGPA